MDIRWEEAVRQGDVETVRDALDGDADVNARDRHGQTGLMLAVVAGHEDVALRLAEAGAEHSLRGTGAPGFAGKTACDLAVERGMRELAARLTAKR